MPEIWDWLPTTSIVGGTRYELQTNTLVLSVCFIARNLSEDGVAWDQEIPILSKGWNRNICLPEFWNLYTSDQIGVRVQLLGYPPITPGAKQPSEAYIAFRHKVLGADGLHTWFEFTEETPVYKVTRDGMFCRKDTGDGVAGWESCAFFTWLCDSDVKRVEYDIILFDGVLESAEEACVSNQNAYWIRAGEFRLHAAPNCAELAAKNIVPTTPYYQRMSCGFGREDVCATVLDLAAAEAATVG